MNKSSGAISLVLLGTALALAGCSSRSDEDEGDWSEDDGQQGHRGTWSHRSSARGSAADPAVAAAGP